MSDAKNAFRSALVDGLSDPEIRDYDLWEPQPGPQTEAFYSEADELFYGGAAGGGKTDSILGIAMRNHQRTIVFRREFPQFKALIRRANDILRPIGVTYKQNWSWWEFPDGRFIELASVPNEQALDKYFGRPHDLIAFDEGVQFPEFWYRLLAGWNRHEDSKQRCRVLFCSNPPLNDEGSWVINYWAPWLDPDYPNPAEPGELRWFVNIDDKSIEVENNNPIELEGRSEPIIPRSRTFIPAKVADNKYYRDSNYSGSVLGNMPEEIRVVLQEGLFFKNSAWNAFQVIPSRLVRAAQDRWQQPDLTRLPDAIGIDPARGGDDSTAIALLYYPHFVIKTIPGKRTPDGPKVAAAVLKELENYSGKIDDIPIGVDPVGVGGAVIDALVANNIGRVQKIFAQAKSRSRDPKLRTKYYNLRAQYHFGFRRALENEPLGIPKGAEILADLTAPRYDPATVRGIIIEDKKELKTRIGRSPDRGEAFMLCWHAYRNSTVLSAQVIDEW